MPRKIVFLSLFILLVFSLSASYQAAELAATEGVSVSKTWIIEFSHKLDTGTINEDTVYITDSSNEKVPLETPNTSVEKQVALTPQEDYAYGETYTIHISKDVRSANGKFLTEDVSKVFSTINSVADGMIEISEGGNIEQKNDELTLDSERLEPATVGPAPEDFEYIIRYVARALPIEIDGTTVQANDITIAGNRAFVAYNTAGEVFNGGIQVIDISDEENPSILHEIKLREMDINAVYYDSETNELVFGGGANLGVYGFKSFISKCDADNPTENEIQSNLTPLSSYHLTSITKYNEHYFVAVGAADGGILELNEYFGLVNSRDETDIRDIEVYSDGILALAGTTDGNTGYTGESGPGKLIRSLDNPGTDIEICDFASSGHKATLDIYDGQAILDDEDALVFMALSQEGLKILALGGQEYNNQVVYELSNPEGQYTETNSVSYDGGLAFVANGGYGFRVLRLNGLSIIDEQTGELGLTDDFASIIGYHELSGSIYDGQSYSANHIEYKQRNIPSSGQVLEKSILFVASGDSGVNIYTLTNPDTYEMIEIPDDMMDTIDELIKENDIEEDDPLVNNDYALIPLEDAQITITFVFEEATYKNQLGYFTFSGNKEDINDLSQIELNDILFENVSAQGSGGSLLAGYSKLIGTFEPGQNIGFYLKQNGYENPDPTIFYSLSALNSDSKKHYGMYIDGDYQKIVMFYEDLTNLGDHDYDDGIFIIHIEPSLDAIDTTGILTAEELEGPQEHPEEPDEPAEDSSLEELQSNIEQLVEALAEENIFEDASWSYARSGESVSDDSWSIKLEEFLEYDPESGEPTPGTNRYGFVNPVPAPNPLYAGEAIINWTNMNLSEEYWNPAVFITNHSLYAYDFPETDEYYQRLKGSMIFYKTDDADNMVYYYCIGAGGSKGPLNSFTLPAEE